MALDIASAQAKLRDITATFDREMAGAAPFYPSVCTTVPSSGTDEKYGWAGALPGVREWIGERRWSELRAANYTLVNKHWESSLLIKKTDIADDRVSHYGPVLAELAAEAAYHPDELLFEAIVNAESTACFDGQFFFDTDHTWGDSGAQSNDVTYNVADTANVTAAEMKAAIRQAVRTMLDFKNDQGKFLHRPTVNRLNDLMLVVPLEMRDQTFDALESQLLGGGDSNVVIDRPRIVSTPHLTTATKFYLFRVGTPLRPFVFQAREPLSRGMNGLTDLETKDVKFMTEARYNVGYAAWWNAILTTVT